ncbi:Disease resistance protein RPP8 [Acorus calamus]|uniref:Disease resistance protein RPP8 n=1 Tax=Acorus calamus TaxID=4465 RepID=A0AAV9ETP4_ACOCL|nr:Disease resistance protein RPP8 [Acorus calamus]
MTEKMVKLLVFQEHEELCEMNLHGRIGKLPVVPNGGFPPNITKLYLSQSKLTKSSFSVLEQLLKLRFLTISDQSYAEKELVCRAGGFLQLESLEIDKIDEIERWVVEEGAMPMLRTLTISYCGWLAMLPEGLQHVKSLQELLLKSLRESFLARVREGEGEDWWMVKHIPKIIIQDVINVQALAAVGWGN